MGQGSEDKSGRHRRTTKVESLTWFYGSISADEVSPDPSRSAYTLNRMRSIRLCRKACKSSSSTLLLQYNFPGKLLPEIGESGFWIQWPSQTSFDLAKSKLKIAPNSSLWSWLACDPFLISHLSCWWSMMILWSDHQFLSARFLVSHNHAGAYDKSLSEEQQLRVYPHVFMLLHALASTNLLLPSIIIIQMSSKLSMHIDYWNTHRYSDLARNLLVFCLKPVSSTLFDRFQVMVVNKVLLFIETGLDVIKFIGSPGQDIFACSSIFTICNVCFEIITHTRSSVSTS